MIHFTSTKSLSINPQELLQLPTPESSHAISPIGLHTGAQPGILFDNSSTLRYSPVILLIAAPVFVGIYCLYFNYKRMSALEHIGEILIDYPTQLKRHDEQHETTWENFFDNIEIENTGTFENLTTDADIEAFDDPFYTDFMEIVIESPHENKSMRNIPNLFSSSKETNTVRIDSLKFNSSPRRESVVGLKNLLSDLDSEPSKACVNLTIPRGITTSIKSKN